MKHNYLVLSLLTSVMLLASCQSDESDKAWQHLSNPSSKNLASSFANPPGEYATWIIWGWEGPMTEEVILRDIERFHSLGVKALSIEAGYGMDNAPYLSEGWFSLVKYAAEQAKERDMHIWMIDEGKYPSGFAGGKFSQERPDLRMQALYPFRRVQLKGGERYAEAVPDITLSVVASNRDEQITELIAIKDGKVDWTAPKNGTWDLQFITCGFKTSVTRAANNPTRGKDTTNSLCDYLNPLATKQFIDFTHEQYKQHLGELWGTTVFGFRGDEPDYGYTPWTPAIDSIFEARKGYDVKPYVGLFFSQLLNDEQRQIKADYWDVWSDLFRNNFFGVQGKWHQANGVEYLVHLNHEHNMVNLTKSSGDFFRNMRYVQIPGVDAIWDQIFPGKINNFPKLASSSAHLFGRPQSFSETFAAYYTKPTPAQAKWILDYQFARGINVFEIMFWSSSAKGPGTGGSPGSWMESEEFPGIMSYINRTGYILSQGTPASTIGLYYPTSSMFMGDNASNTATWNIVQDLIDNQYDFDFVDEQSLGELMSIEMGKFKNLSGQSYETVIIPSCSVIPEKVYKALETFATQGGTVIIMGDAPTKLVGTTYTKLSDIPSWTFAVSDTSRSLSENIKALLPRDLILDAPQNNFSYLHRSLKDADLYFIFNEGDAPFAKEVTLKGNGKVQKWDATTGVMSDAEATKASDGYISTSLSLAPWETTIVVVDK